MGVSLRRPGALLLPATPNPTRRNDVPWARMPANQTPPIAPSNLTKSAAMSSAGHRALIDRGLPGLGNSALHIWLGILTLPLILGVALSRSLPRQSISSQNSRDQAHA